MNDNPKLWPSRAARLAPILLVALGGLAILALRGPMPLDEIRYTEVLRELLTGSKWLLTLNGEPYSHKTPLFFWFGWLALQLGLPLNAALLVWPPLFTALTVGLVGSLGRRLGVARADWIYAALLMPGVYAGVALFDSLMTAAVVLFLWALATDRRWLAALVSVPMMLAKGPVALLFALPFGMQLVAAPTARRRFWRVALLLAPGVLCLGVWAWMAIAQSGGAASAAHGFALELLWTQTAGRVVNSFAHARPFYWYMPFLLLGTLPFTAQWRGVWRVLVAREASRLRGLARALGVVLVVLSSISGKQPHYLLPALPIVAILFAHSLGSARQLACARGLGAAQLGALMGVVVCAQLGWPVDVLGAYAERGSALRASASWRGLLAASVLVAGIALVGLLRLRLRADALAATFAVGLFALLLPLHAAVGRLSMPSRVGRPQFVERLAGHPVAVIKVDHGGLYSLLLERTDLDFLSGDSSAELRAWCLQNPGGHLFVDEKYAALCAGLPVIGIATDRIRGKPMRVYEVHSDTLVEHAPR